MTTGATKLASMRCTPTPTPATASALGRPDTPRAMSAGHDGGEEGPEERHDGRDAGEDAEGEEVGDAERPEARAS